MFLGMFGIFEDVFLYTTIHTDNSQSIAIARSTPSVYD